MMSEADALYGKFLREQRGEVLPRKALGIGLVTIDRDGRGLPIQSQKAIRFTIAEGDEKVEFNATISMAIGFAETLLRLARMARECEHITAPMSQTSADA